MYLVQKFGLDCLTGWIRSCTNDAHKMAVHEFMRASLNLTVGGKIGRESSAVVYEGKLNGNPVAVKKIHSTLLEAEDWRISESLLQLAHLLKQLSHPHIVTFIDFYHSKVGDHILVMERLDCNPGSYLECRAGRLSCQR